MTTPDPRRAVPRTDAVLADPRLADALARHGRERVKDAVRAAQQAARAGQVAPQDVAAHAAAALPARIVSGRRVHNATGVVLHTNIGRAQLSDVAVEAVAEAARATDVELDLATGARARRGRGALAALAARVPDAGGVLAVNNGAAALALTALTLAGPGGEVLVSRGEMVEIGDGFRLPALVESVGVRIREVGTTNRTRLADYADAITERTGAILKIHPSNFRVEGFTSEATVAELATQPVPVVHDIGSGLLGPVPLLPDEPDAATSLRAGAAVVTCSGDKLLGGPQAGLVLGRADIVERVRRHPLQRAFRVDKLTLAALEATLAAPTTPTWDSLLATLESLRAKASRLRDAVGAGEVVVSTGRVGGGSAPGLDLPGYALALPQDTAMALREHAVLARVEHGRTLLDVRALADDELDAVAAACRAVLAAGAPAAGAAPAFAAHDDAAAPRTGLSDKETR